MRLRSVSLAVLLAAATAVGQSPTPTPVPAPAAPPAGELVSPGQALIDQEQEALAGRAYSYDRARGERPPGIAGMSIDDIVVHGIWRTRTGFIAQVRGVDNKSYLVRAGDLLYDGEVTRVGPNEVVFRQNINDPQSVKPFREVTKQLNVTIRP